MTTYVHYYILGNVTEIFSVRSRSLHRMHGILKQFDLTINCLVGRVAFGGGGGGSKTAGARPVDSY